MSRRVALIDHDSTYDDFESVANRSRLTHGLMEAYEEIAPLITRVSTRAAEYDDLLAFHSNVYLDILRDGADASDEDLAAYGLQSEGDCPFDEQVFDYVRKYVGSSIECASLLSTNDIAINWSGGWHHASVHEARGFCYANDCVILIDRLLDRFERVLYIDIDCHHGDAVETAFVGSSRVLTWSVHCYNPGSFFPGSGGLDSPETFSINSPLQQALTDEQFIRVFSSVSPLLLSKFQPDCVVLQCGADALSDDPLGRFCLTEESYVFALRQIIAADLPLVCLGGGGYHAQQAARLWTRLTAECVGVSLPNQIPLHDNFKSFSPSFMLNIVPSFTINSNTDRTIGEIIERNKCSIASLL